MTQVTLPETSHSGDANLFANCYSNDTAITSVVNGNLDNGNLSSTAAVALSKLASGTTGQLIVCNSSGVPTYVTASGDVTAAAGGALTIGAGKVTSGMLASGAALANLASASVTDAKLASPNNAAWKTIFNSATRLSASTTLNSSPYGLVSGSSDVSLAAALTAAGSVTGILAFYNATTDRAVTGLAEQLRVRAQLLVGAAPGTVTYTVGLYPISASGGYVISGTVVSGSTVAFVTPSANTTPQDASSAFAAPSAGVYALGVTVSAGPSTAVSVQAQLQSNNA